MSEKNMPHEQNENSLFAETSSDTANTKELKKEGNNSALTKQEATEQTGYIGSQEQPDTKKKASFKNLPKGARIAIIVSAIAVVLILAVVILAAILKKDNVENNSIIVYRNGNECIIRIYNQEVSVESVGADNFKADKEAKLVCFTVPSSQDEEYFDLYYVQLVKGDISKPALIDNAVENNYEIANNKVYYLKYNNKTFADDGCICDMDSKKITTFSSNVNGIYYLDDTNVYFTKPDGDNLALYCYSNNAVNDVARNVTELACFSETEKPHIIYQTNSGEYQSASSLYIAYSGKSPELICDNANTVAFDAYEPGGNLYYYTSSQESISWSYVISDQFYDSDKSITKPDEWDFLWDFLGVSDSYAEAMAAYAEKTSRDRIRKALDETAAVGGITAPVFTVFAYNGKNTVKLVEGVDPSRVYSYSPFGEPKIVYEKTSVKQGETDIATLCEMSKQNDIEEVIAYAKSIVAECVESQGVAVADVNGSYNLNEYDKNTTVFTFSQKGNSLFALVNDSKGGNQTLYCNSFGNSGVSEGKTVSANVKSNSVAVSGESVIYIISDADKATGDVYSFCDGNNVKLSNSAHEFVLDDSNHIFVIKNEVTQNDSVKGDYYTQFGGAEIGIGKDVPVASFILREDGSAAFVEADENGGTRLVIYYNGETTEVCKGSTQVLLYK